MYDTKLKLEQEAERLKKEVEAKKTLYAQQTRKWQRGRLGKQWKADLALMHEAHLYLRLSLRSLNNLLIA